MVKKKKNDFFGKRFEVKKVVKPAPVLSPAQRRELVRGIAGRTEIKPVTVEPTIEPIEEMFPEEPIEKIFEEPIVKKSLRIKSDILKHEEGSILTRNKNIFFKE